jgi:predicted phosphodiesterase
MKVAITADVHLKRYNETPERYRQLEKILAILAEQGVSDLIIVGDLFDRQADSYIDFDQLAGRYASIRITVLPGNHDPSLDSRYFTAANIDIIREVCTRQWGSRSFVLVPYREGKMDEVLAEYSRRSGLPDAFVLVGHGDYVTKDMAINRYESGIYMPLSAHMVTRLAPVNVFLGHIHKPGEKGEVVYCGSPYPLDINETGKRRFLLFDTETHQVESVPVETEVIYFIESLLALPVEDEKKWVEAKLSQIIAGWPIRPEEYPNVRLRLYVRGCTKDQRLLMTTINTFLASKGIAYYDSLLNEEALYSRSERPGPIIRVNEKGDPALTVLADSERIDVFDKVRETIDKDETLPADRKEDILERALELIFSS